jgi:hypothetical protein
MAIEVERYIAGGQIYFAELTDGTYGTEYEIGELTEATIDVNREYAEAFNKDAGQKVLAAKVLKQEDYTCTFKSQNINATNLALALGSEVETINYIVGDALPDGTTATETGTYKRIDAGSKSVIVGRIRFISAPQVGKKRIVELPKAHITLSGSIALMSEDFATLDFEASAMKDDTTGKYYREYIM